MTTPAGLFVMRAEDAPATPGAYILRVDLAEPLDFVFAGRPARLEPGCYAYCGSAKGPGGLRARLSRHMRRDKSIRRHIDHLTQAGRARGAWIFENGDECALARRLARLETPLPGFGASDCKSCRSHLFLSGESDVSLKKELTGPARHD